MDEPADQRPTDRSWDVQAVVVLVTHTALERFDGKLTEAQSVEISHQVERLLGSVMGEHGLSDLVIWSAGCIDNEVYQDAWATTLQRDFTLTAKALGNKYLTDRIGCNALVVARAQLALSIHLLGYLKEDVSELVAFQGIRSDKGETLHRPEDSQPFSMITTCRVG